MNPTTARAALHLDRALRAVQAAEREWLVAYVADAEDTPETDIDLRVAASALAVARTVYAEALQDLDAARDAR